MLTNRSRRKDKSCLDSSPLFYTSMKASFSSHPFQGARLALCCALLCLIEATKTIKTESVSRAHKPKHTIPLIFFFLGTEAKLQELATEDSGICQVLSSSDFQKKLKERLEVPRNISEKRSTRPPPRFVTSCSPPLPTAALPASPPSP